jgi:hypothetical protein
MGLDLESPVGELCDTSDSSSDRNRAGGESLVVEMVIEERSRDRSTDAVELKTGPGGKLELRSVGEGELHLCDRNSLWDVDVKSLQRS